MRLRRPGEDASEFYVYACASRPETQTVKDPVTDKTLLGLTATYQQTFTPNSVNPGGEDLEYESRGDPAQVTAEELVECFRQLSAATLLAAHWPTKASRLDAVSALAGMLIRDGWSWYRADRFITRIAYAAGDREFSQRQSSIESIAKRFSNGEAIPGAAALGDLLPNEIVRAAAKYLGIKLPMTVDEIVQNVIDAVTETAPGTATSPPKPTGSPSPQIRTSGDDE